MTSKSPVRSCDDIDEAALSYAEVKALATGNPYIREKMDLDIQVSKLKLLKANHMSQKYRLEDDIVKYYPMRIAELEERAEGYREDIQTYTKNKFPDKETFSMRIGKRDYTDKKMAGAALIELCKSVKKNYDPTAIGEYRGFCISVYCNPIFSVFQLELKGRLRYKMDLGSDLLGNLQRIKNLLEALPVKLADTERELEKVKNQFETAKEEVKKPFKREQELKEKQDRLTELNCLLNMGEETGPEKQASTKLMRKKEKLAIKGPCL